MKNGLYTLSDYDIFKESDGYWKAVRTDADGARRNIAPYNCATKREATRAVVEDRDWLNTQEGIA